MHPQLPDMNFHRNHSIMCFLKPNSSFVNTRSGTYTLTGDPRNFKTLMLCWPSHLGCLLYKFISKNKTQSLTFKVFRYLPLKTKPKD
jgi:hypothetical protein